MFKRIFRRCFKFAIFSWDFELSLKLRHDKLRKKVIGTTLVALPLALIYYGIVSSDLPPHNFSDSECFRCHVTIPQPGDLRPYRFISPINTLCTECHTQLSAISHFTNVQTSETYEVHFPVTDPGSLTCATCHDPHLPAINPATGNKTYFLRGGVTGKMECQLCHSSNLSPQGLTTRRPVMDTAHGVAHFTVLFDPAIDYSGRDLHILNTRVTLDQLSVYCLNCHDSPSNPEYTSPGSAVYKHAADNGLSHPVGIDCDEVAQRNKYIKTNNRDPRLMLFDGKIGCCTCHDPYAIGGGLGLRIGDKTGWQELCMGCHIR